MHPVSSRTPDLASERAALLVHVLQLGLHNDDTSIPKFPIQTTSPKRPFQIPSLSIIALCFWLSRASVFSFAVMF